MLIFVLNAMPLKMISLILSKEIESIFLACMHWIKLTLWHWMSSIFWIKSSIMFLSPVILDGISINWLTECGNIWTWSEYTPNQKEKTRTTMLQSSYQESSAESKTSVTKFTEIWLKTSDMPWSGVARLNLTHKKSVKIINLKMRTSYKLLKRSEKEKMNFIHPSMILYVDIYHS